MNKTQCICQSEAPVTTISLTQRTCDVCGDERNDWIWSRSRCYCQSLADSLFVASLSNKIADTMQWDAVKRKIENELGGSYPHTMGLTQAPLSYTYDCNAIHVPYRPSMSRWPGRTRPMFWIQDRLDRNCGFGTSRELGMWVETRDSKLGGGL